MVAAVVRPAAVVAAAEVEDGDASRKNAAWRGAYQMKPDAVQGSIDMTHTDGKTVY